MRFALVIARVRPWTLAAVSNRPKAGNPLRYQECLSTIPSRMSAASSARSVACSRSS